MYVGFVPETNLFVCLISRVAQELSMNIGDKTDLELTNLGFTGEDQTDGWKHAAGLNQLTTADQFGADQMANGGAKQSTNMTVMTTNTQYQVTSQQVRLVTVT